jgi:ASC-1-like (ASCH) protein
MLKFRAVDREGFENIRTGKKRVETRAATEKCRKVAVGDEIVFACGKERLAKRVKRVYRWRSIAAMLREVPLARIMPGIKSVGEARKVYASYPGYTEKLRKHGLVGWELT